MENIKIGVTENGLTTLATAGKYCDRNIEIDVKVAGGGSEDCNGRHIPDEALNITGSCNYKFAYGGWDWFIRECGDQITTNNITDAKNMFEASKLESIPFNINIDSTNVSICYVFNKCKQLKEVPYIIGPERTPPTGSYSGAIDLNYLFYQCDLLREIPYDFFWKMIPNKDFWDKCETVTNRSYNSMFYGCYSLRELPDLSMLNGVWTSYYSSIYYDAFSYSFALNKVTNFPVSGTFSSNSFSGFAAHCRRLNELTFQLGVDGLPKVANWKNQTIDLTNFVGYSEAYSAYNLLNYNSGITADKEVKDAATYEALKNDPDWYATDINYSRYNHDSAVNTINSLPDCSAYGTNTIKFKGDSGALTDGGAINTLTEAEIAVAAAKGWTVTLA